MMPSLPPDFPAFPSAQAANDSALAWAEGDANLRALLAAGVPTSRALLRWGADLLRAGRGADAVSAFRAAVPLAPEDALAWTNLGIAFARTGAEAASVECLDRSVALARAQPDAWLLLAMGREKQGELALAEAAYRVALELGPTSAAGWRCLGALLQRKRDADGAIVAFRECLKHGPPDAAVSATLGKMFYEQGRVPEAHAAYAAAAVAEPGNAYFGRIAKRTAFMRDLIAGESVDRAIANLNREGTEPASADEELAELFEASYSLLAGFGHHDAALRLARRRVELWPASAVARYLLASLRGESNLPRSPDDYIVASFDRFAERFDTQLVDVLGYDVPQQLSGLVRDFAVPGRLDYVHALDAGCGTGLCGPLLRPVARRLTGVDLSPKMLARAAERGVYDALVCEELTAFLARSGRSFDLIVAADVLVYFGELRSIFDAAAIALQPKGLFVFSTEANDSADHRILPSGRFAHAPAYVEAVAAGAFETRLARATTLRFEGRERVRGVVFVLQRRDV
jgi:predicted TPR repeat methyltransferase